MNYKNYINCLSIVFFLLLAIAKSDEPYNERNPSAFDRQISYTVSSDYPNIEWVTPQNREAVVRRIKLFRSMPGFSNRANNCGIALVKLGDEDAIAQAVEDFHDDTARSDRWGGTALLQATVEALPYFINDLYTADPKPREGGEVNGPSRRYAMTTRVLGIIGRSKELPPETREWAYSFRGIDWHDVKKWDDLARTVEGWWEHNEKAIMARKYGEAKWLPSQPNEKVGSLSDPDDARRVLPRKPGGSKAPPVEDGRSKPGTYTPVANTNDQAPLPGGWSLWAGIAAAFAAFAGWMFMRGRGTKRD
jgi:hypothetical protein